MKQIWLVSSLSLLASLKAAAEPFRVAEFDQKVLPMVERYCMGCHDRATAEGDFDLESFLTPAAMLANRKPWEKVVKQLKADAMPPDGKKRPAVAEREGGIGEACRCWRATG